MSKNKRRLWLLSMLFIYIAIAMAGFVIVYIIKNDFLPKNASSTAPVTTSVSQIPVPKDWKTYTNNDAKISFAYPQEDSIKASSYGFGVTSVLLQKTNAADFQILLVPKSLAQVVGQNFDTYYALPNNTTKVIKSPLSKDNRTEKFTKIRNRTIIGLKALDYQSIGSDAKPGSQPEIGTFIVAGNNIVLFSTGASNKKTLEQMLSSFTYSP